MRPSLIDRLATCAFVLVPLAFGLYALTLGQDANWDLRNYHWYNPYALLNHRMATDLAPAQIASFYNPLLDVPVFLLGRVLPARAMGFTLGVVQGLNFVIVFWLAEMCLSDLAPVVPAAARRGAAAIVALVGVLGAGFLSLVGTAFNDGVVSLFILAAVGLIIRNGTTLLAARSDWPGKSEILPLLASGALCGIAVGLKLPTAPFAVGACLAFLCVGGGLVRRFVQAFVFGIGVMLGFAVAGAPWMAVLWRDYANPLFPYFNGVFHSPMGVDDSYRDLRFLPATIGDAVMFPFVFGIDPASVGEIGFSDHRVATAYTLLLITAVVATVRRWRGGQPELLTPAARYLIAAAGWGYGTWMLVFGIYRYIVPLEMLAPLLSVLALGRWPWPVRMRRAVIVAVLAFLTVTTVPGDWEHHPWRPGAFVTAQVPPLAEPATTLALVTGTEPVAWLIPFFPPEIPFIRIQGYLNGPGQAKNGLNDRARARIAAHRGAFFALLPKYEVPGAVEALTFYGLRLDEPSCQPVPSNLGDYVLWCRVYRSDPPPGPDPA